MSTVRIAIVLHVAMGTVWTLATLAIAISRRTRAGWLRGLLGIALVNMAAGIYLWHALHAGPWGAIERLLVVGTFCAFAALGMQAPVAFMLSGDARRLEGPPLAVYRVTAIALVAAAAAMLASRLH